MVKTGVLTLKCGCGINRRYNSTYISLRSLASSGQHLPVLVSFFEVQRDTIPITQSSHIRRQYTSEDNHHASNLNPFGNQVHTPWPNHNLPLIADSQLSSSLLLLLPLSTHASPELFKRNNQNTCTPTRTTYVTTQTITTSSQPYCPTITSTIPNGYLCVKPSTTCGPHPECITEKSVTVPCPAKCCPKQTPTTTVKATCTTTCQEGCATQTQYVTATNCGHDDDHNDSK